LIVGNPQQHAVFAYRSSGWQRLPFRLPEGTTIVDAEGRDAGLRFVDFDEDGRADVIFSNAQRYAAYAFSSLTEVGPENCWLRNGPAKARVCR